MRGTTSPHRLCLRVRAWSCWNAQGQANAFYTFEALVLEPIQPPDSFFPKPDSVLRIYRVQSVGSTHPDLRCEGTYISLEILTTQRTGPSFLPPKPSPCLYLEETHSHKTDTFGLVTELTCKPPSLLHIHPLFSRTQHRHRFVFPLLLKPLFNAPPYH